MWTLSAFIVSAIAAGIEFHVAPNGLDTNPGAADSPFATLTQARDALRASNAAANDPIGDATIWIHGGDYFIGDTITLDAADSGTESSQVFVRAMPGESPRLVGGIIVGASAFRPANDADLPNRLPQESRPNIFVADLASLGVEETGAFPDQFVQPPLALELFFNDRRMILARWPNEGWAEIANVIESGPAPWRNHESSSASVFEYSGDRPLRWMNAPAVWLEGYWCFDWSSEAIRIGAIEPGSHTITLGARHVYGLGGGNPGPRRYYALNLLEELDAPGEYYVDPYTKLLYFWPPEPIEGARIVVSSLETPIVALRDAAFVTIQGITIENCRGIALEVAGGHDNAILACTIRNTGHMAISIAGGEKHRVEACDIYDTGTGGMSIGGGDRKTLTPSGHQAVNNHIYRFSRRQRTYAPAIQIDGVGVLVAHNLLHDAPHMAIGLAGNDHIVEYNEIHRVTLETDDCGAFYMGRNPSHRGNIIRFNYWHELGAPFGHGNNAVYFDDGDGGQLVFGNVFYRCGNPGKSNMGAVFNHGGHDNLIENNIFIECKRAIGAAPWNDATWAEWINGDLWRTRLLEEVNITEPPYITRYPELEGFMTPSDKPRMNRAVRNVAVNCEAFISGNYEEVDNLVLDEDPGFVDAATQNFQLREDAPLIERLPGFQPIPFSEIGLYNDELRTDASARWD